MSIASPSCNRFPAARSAAGCRRHDTGNAGKIHHTLLYVIMKY